jgi:nitroimidazol reductase NimA-like FMN-containing flavoprotein (pyridoxamine 5'-phosphate oxidase superfamily)
MSVPLAMTERTRVRRLPDRGNYERAEAYAILDEGLVCHVGFVVDGQPYVIPTTYARCGDRLVVHGSPASRMLRGLKGGIPVCITVTLLDGLVLARSAFHHSMNYRSVVVLGQAEPLTELPEKLAALEALVEHIVPGRRAHARGPSPAELKQTLALTVALDEASVKARRGGPIDDDDDLALPVWAGVVPLRMEAGPPLAEPDLPTGVVVPDYAAGYRRGVTR